MSVTLRRVLDLGIAVAVAVGIVGGVLLYAEFGPFTWMPGVRWFQFAGATALVFGITIKEYRRHWRHPRFWVTIGGLFAVHAAVYCIALARSPNWRLIWFLLPMVAEGFALVWILKAFGFQPHLPYITARRDAT